MEMLKQPVQMFPELCLVKTNVISIRYQSVQSSLL